MIVAVKQTFDPRSGAFRVQERDASQSSALREFLKREGGFFLELGTGKGMFFDALCGTYPDRNCIGIERRWKRCRGVEKRTGSSGRVNALIIQGRIEVVIRELLPANNFERIFMNFPDPWPKRRMKKHRTLNPDTASDIVRILEPGGTFLMATDCEDYCTAAWNLFNDREDCGLLPQPAVHSLFSDIGLEHSCYASRTLRENRSIYMMGVDKTIAS